MTSAVEIVRELVDVTTRQVAAAVRIDGGTLSALNEQRADLLFALQVSLGSDVSDADKQRLRPLVRELDVLERRLRSAATQVVRTIDHIVPQAPPTTYGRRGLVL